MVHVILECFVLVSIPEALFDGFVLERVVVAGCKGRVTKRIYKTVRIYQTVSDIQDG